MVKFAIRDAQKLSSSSQTWASPPSDEPQLRRLQVEDAPYAVQICRDCCIFSDTDTDIVPGVLQSRLSMIVVIYRWGARSLKL